MPNVLLERIVPHENMDTSWTMSHLSYRLWTNMSWAFWHYSYKRTQPFHNSTNILKYFNHVRQLFNASWTPSVFQFGQLKHSILYGHRPITLNNPIQSCSTKLVLQINGRAIFTVTNTDAMNCIAFDFIFNLHKILFYHAHAHTNLLGFLHFIPFYVQIELHTYELTNIECMPISFL